MSEYNLSNKKKISKTLLLIYQWNENLNEGIFQQNEHKLASADIYLFIIKLVATFKLLKLFLLHRL